MYTTIPAAVFLTSWLATGNQFYTPTLVDAYAALGEDAMEGAMADYMASTTTQELYPRQELSA